MTLLIKLLRVNPMDDNALHNDAIIIDGLEICR